MYLIAALALLLQDKTAEETFKKIEESIEKAKTLSITFSVGGMATAKEGQNGLFQASGVMLLKEGGRFNCVVKRRLEERELENSIVCDGTKVSHKRDQSAAEVIEVPKVYRGAASTLVARVGTMMGGLFQGTGGPDEDVKKTLALKDLRVGEDDGGAKTLLYTVSLGPATLDCRLWYEPKTLKLLKRTMKIRKGESVEGSLTESYVEYIVNADIPDEKFKLQAGK
jgi:outer membrane lipoprotein-sorting protein